MPKPPVLIKNILISILKAYNLEKPLKQHSSVLLWQEVVEQSIKQKTKAVSYRNGKLFVEAETSTLRNELVFKKELLKKLLNERVGEQVVQDIVFINRR